MHRLYPNANAFNHQYPGQRIAALSAIGVPEIRLRAARIINDIRNACAHDGKETLLPEDVKKLHAAVNVMLVNPVSENWAFVEKSANEPDCIKEFGSMSLKERFCFLGGITIGTLAAFSAAATTLN